LDRAQSAQGKRLGLSQAFAHITARMKAKPARVIALQQRLRIRAGDEIALGPGKAKMLELLRQTGSITKAARQMGMSYMRAWTLIQTMNQCFKEPLVKTIHGGRAGGGAELTDSGRKVLELYQKMEKDGLRAMSGGWRQLRKILRN
jgi:molybdate transport system regulatory protein